MRYGAVALGLTLFVSVLVAGCEVIGAGEEDLQPGTYSFVAYDSSGAALIQGTLNLRYPQDSGWDIEGTWESEGVQEIEGWTGRMVGEGQLRGTKEKDGGVQVSLRPRFEDADAVLQGEVNGSTLQGEWAIVDWGRTSRSGRFVAVPK